MKTLSRYEIWLNGKLYLQLGRDKNIAIREIRLRQEDYPADVWCLKVVYELPPEEVTWGL